MRQSNSPDRDKNKVRICVDSDLVPPKVLEYILENNLYIKRDDTYPKLAEVKNIDDFQNVVGEVTYQKALSHIPPQGKPMLRVCK